VELRQLEAFVAVATELHFGRAAERLRIAQPTLSELVQRLERDVSTPLLTRTTRRVALTGAGFELLGRAKVILDDVAAANAAVRRVASGEAARFASASHHQSCQCLRLTLPQHCSRGHQTSPSRCEGCGSPI
jgi:DNA-binding transcriptional LysR family regulator